MPVVRGNKLVALNSSTYDKRFTDGGGTWTFNGKDLNCWYEGATWNPHLCMGDTLTVARRLGSGWIRARNHRNGLIITLRVGDNLQYSDGRPTVERTYLNEMLPVTLIERRGFKALTCDVNENNEVIQDEIDEIDQIDQIDLAKIYRLWDNLSTREEATKLMWDFVRKEYNNEKDQEINRLHDIINTMHKQHILNLQRMDKIRESRNVQRWAY